MLFSLPLLVGFWLAVSAVAGTRYKYCQQKGLLCLCLLCLYLVFLPAFKYALPDICSFLEPALHSYPLAAFAFTWIYRLPERPDTDNRFVPAAHKYSSL